MNMTRTLTALVTAFTLAGGGTAVADQVRNAAPESTLCADMWQVGETIPADYTGCDMADGTRYVDPFGARFCIGDLEGPKYVRSPDRGTMARLGGPVLDGEAKAREDAVCLGMSDWLFDTETVNA